MKIEILTLFPDSYTPLYQGIIGSAVEKGLVDLHITNIRDYSTDKHKHVDDAPFGGGAGMLMAIQPIADAIDAIDPMHKMRRIYMSPKGIPFTQAKSKQLAQQDLLILCGSYEGIDERVIELYIDEEISIGDYVLTSGDLAAMVVVNATMRHIEGVLGSSTSLEEESFTVPLLEYPQYTRPAEYKGLKVPEVLLSGNHQKIAEWRRLKSIEITRERRPDLLNDED
ncbi:MAG: tRNA (guanosine(37)-N1)-methyltransferase TrmD [Clostridia bacterium]|nr:tRNA (guanosine(37)-N1)-methyltransferase TrmD [Clostridia bacterium]